MARDDGDQAHPLRPICNAWVEKINLAIKHKQPWQRIADECEGFFSATGYELWDPKNKDKFWRTDTGPVNPKFKLIVARAFEMVALFGPTLYWRNPVRTATPRDLPDLPPEAFGLDQNVMAQVQQAVQQQQQAAQQGQPAPPLDPMLMQMQAMLQQAQQMFQQAQQEYQREALARKVRADLMSRYLNWTPNALGLHSQAEQAITQALVSGMGCLWTEPYVPPGSNKVIIGSWFDPVENLVVDPDSETFENAWWIARKCTEPVWKVERDRGFRQGELQKYASLESAERQSEMTQDNLANNHRATGQSQDLMVYWKIWSRCGLARLKELKSEIKDKIEKVTGDYVYIEVTSGCPFPLNMPTSKLLDGGASNEEVARAFRWPIPFWKKDSWPVTPLMFYRRAKKLWPIAPLAPGLGELKAIQILYSHMVNKVWMTQRTFLAVLKSASEEVKRIIQEGDDLSIIPLEQIQGSIKDVVQFLEHPPMNADTYRILESLLEMFDRRTGLTDLLYGVQNTQSRSATDVKIREQMTNVRPEYMASKTEEWMSMIAKKEALATRWYIIGDDVSEQMGNVGKFLWDQFIVNSPVERTINEIDYRVEASSAQRPNKARDTANLDTFINVFGPILDQHANATGDTTALNALIQRWGKTNEMDVTELQLGQRPTVDPAQQQAQMEQQQQMQQQQFQMQMAMAQAKLQEVQVKAQADQQKMQMDAALSQQKLQADMMVSQQELAQDQQQHDQEMAQDAQRHQLDMQQMLDKAAVEGQVLKQKMLFEKQSAQQQMQTQKAQARTQIDTQKQVSKAKVAQAKKPKPQPASQK